MRFLATLILLAGSLASAQLGFANNNISVTGDAAINVAPDRVRLNFGVLTRNKSLDLAAATNDETIRRVIAAARKLDIADADIQTDNIRVSLGYDDHNSTLIDYYEITKGIQVTLRDVSKFEPLLMGALRAGANQVYEVEFSTSELRKYRDQARALAIKAAKEKANDLASAASFKVSAKPLGVSAYNYGGGSLVRLLLEQSLRLAVGAERRPECRGWRRHRPRRYRRIGQDRSHRERHHDVWD